MLVDLSDCFYLFALIVKIHEKNIDKSAKYFVIVCLLKKRILIYIIKQDIRIYMSPIVGQTAGLNGLTFFCGHSGVPGGCFRL